jgi:hypothetical protein
VFLLNSRGHLVTATPFRSGGKLLHVLGVHLLPKYGAILPSSFTRVLSSALGFSPRPPVSVYGTVSSRLKLRGFSWKLSISRFVCLATHSSSRLSVDSPDLPREPAYTLKLGHPTPGRPNFLRSPIASRQGTGLLTCFPSTTPFGLALGADSPCAD